MAKVEGGRSLHFGDVMFTALSNGKVWFSVKTPDNRLLDFTLDPDDWSAIVMEQIRVCQSTNKQGKSPDKLPTGPPSLKGEHVSIVPGDVLHYPPEKDQADVAEMRYPLCIKEHPELRHALAHMMIAIEAAGKGLNRVVDHELESIGSAVFFGDDDLETRERELKEIEDATRRVSRSTEAET